MIICKLHDSLLLMATKDNIRKSCKYSMQSQQYSLSIADGPGELRFDGGAAGGGARRGGGPRQLGRARIATGTRGAEIHHIE